MTERANVFLDSRIYRICLFVYLLLVIQVCLVVALLPSAVAVFFLVPDPSNAPLFAVAVIPAGPALVAGTYATGRLLREHEQTPVRDFVRGLRLSWADILKLWVPAVLVLGLVSLNLGVTATGPARAVVLVVLLLAGLWLANVLVITARFSFRARDTARLAAYYLLARWRCALSTLTLLVLAALVLVVTSDWVLLLLLSPALHLLARVTQPLVADVEARFTKK
ncbi:hypothetical protein [Goodfellowiella coeruleoviolacea]|uniref:DUF624 domain-containing protein n=1 Tax=Goodfellowiella coeruleoviolacea TaxID=334858 RepID=A0AAE3GAG6_9PSEU|nr:hypothetical protein [Goodfellowiella coeruleoviolacea]MCP2163394.1 hypothetical protein [Goodfellowiella coeruleoviolacea]